MKKTYAFFASLLLIIPLYGQLNADHNSLRADDIIIKQQVEFKDPGKAGRNCIWDFSNLTTIDDRYELVYSLALLVGDSAYVMGYNQFDKTTTKYADLIVGTEHNTMYYYYQTYDSLLLLGYENAAIKQKNLQPIVNLKFPLNYGETVSSNYKSKGLYSKTRQVGIEGTIEISADAFGKIILPDGDTLNHVLRVKTIQTVIDTDTTRNMNAGTQIESFRWYTKGYRYPIFETIKNSNIEDNEELFSTAFFFPLQDHLYLETDPDNQALLEELWGFPDNGRQAKKAMTEGSLVSGTSYRIYPNPVESILNIDYTLKEKSPVSILLYSLDGRLVRQKQIKEQEAGSYTETLDCSAIAAGNYMLRIKCKGESSGEKIIKL